MNCSRILNYDKIQKLGYKTRMSNKTRMVKCDFYHPKTCVQTCMTSEKMAVLPRYLNQNTVIAVIEIKQLHLA